MGAEKLCFRTRACEQQKEIEERRRRQPRLFERDLFVEFLGPHRNVFSEVLLRELHGGHDTAGNCQTIGGQRCGSSASVMHPIHKSRAWSAG